tara:strand:- start:378 stop:587 length:210 start_codon:yes stop_codon:yes gene_type:complete
MSREEEFKEELKALLGKYQVEISLEDSGTGNWHPHYVISFYGSAKWDKDGEPIHESFDFTGRYFDGDMV